MNNINTIAIVVLAIGSIFIMLNISRLYERDMAVCQLSHSFDTCYNAMNR